MEKKHIRWSLLSFNAQARTSLKMNQPGLKFFKEGNT